VNVLSLVIDLWNLHSTELLELATTGNMSDAPFISSPELRQSTLFEVPPRDAMSPATDDCAGGGQPRLRYAVRDQVEFRACCWDDLLPADHQARIVWDYVLGLDLSPLYKAIKAVEHRPGHPPPDPRILFALWLYATLRGVGSARELDRRCERDTGEVSFQWICGGVTVNYHSLSDFRVAHLDLLDTILTQSIAVLRHEGLVTLERVAQDGMRVRASAGAASFRREATLQEHYQEAQAQVQALKQELDADPTAATRRERAARERAARERAERLAKALEQLPLVQATKQGAEAKQQARVSTTDPEARVMKMPNGGFNPAYNVQLASDTPTQMITGVDAINSGSDRGQLAPMVEQHQERHGKAPDEMLVDGGFATKQDITAVSPPHGNTTVYAPVQKPRKDNVDPHMPRPDDSPTVAQWRVRMATEEAKEIYKERAATAECVNAIARNRGLVQVRVRGRPKVLAVVLWYVLAHNLIRAATLRADRAAGGG
jgi:transposase